MNVKQANLSRVYFLNTRGHSAEAIIMNHDDRRQNEGLAFVVERESSF